MQVLNIGDVANSARNSRNAVCRGNEDVDDYEGRALDEGVESCWSETITIGSQRATTKPSTTHHQQPQEDKHCSYAIHGWQFSVCLFARLCSCR